jgi:hypothetical protein
MSVRTAVRVLAGLTVLGLVGAGLGRPVLVLPTAACATLLLALTYRAGQRLSRGERWAALLLGWLVVPFALLALFG